MDTQREIEISGKQRDRILLTGNWMLGAAVIVVAAAAVAIAYAVPKIVTELSRQSTIPVPYPELEAFEARFPMELGVPSRAAQRDVDFRRGVAQLADAMRSAALLAAPEGVSNADPTGSKVPVPRSRPAAASLMANLGAAGEPRQEAAPGPFNVSEAIRNVFAMLPPGLKLASVNPDGGILSDGKDKAPDLTVYGKQTALYDISARTVYMPDGSRLEAHSGLGELMDDVRFVHVRDRGPTPPAVYELSLREKPFHGVKALRMKAVGESELFGRDGLLTHSYLVGPRGDSNGCVSFKNYDAFLKAFTSGEVKRLVVVKSVQDGDIKVARKT